MEIPFVDLRAQHQSMRDELSETIGTVISDCNFILGDQVGKFEKAFADFVGAGHAVGVSDGLSALKLTLGALGIGPGDEVILPANTFIATALAVAQVGARPVLVDCEPDTYNIAERLIARAISARTKAIIPVHLTGQGADLDPILQTARERQLAVVEDAAQAHGALYKGRPCGSIGATGCFSFYPAKNLGACGDGGMITTNDGVLATRLRGLRNYGQRAKYDHAYKGENSRLDTLQAAILLKKLPRLRLWNESRARHAQEYRQRLTKVGDLRFQGLAPFSTHIYHLFIIETAQRDGLQRHLEANGVQTGIHYPKPIHLQEAFRDLGYPAGSFPVAERLAERMLSLPMFPELSSSQIEYVVSQIRSFFGEVSRI